MEKVEEGPRHEPGGHLHILSPHHPEESLTSPSSPQETGGAKKERDAMGRWEEEGRDAVLSLSTGLLSRWDSSSPE